jgi:hypothetical protein
MKHGFSNISFFIYFNSAGLNSEFFSWPIKCVWPKIYKIIIPLKNKNFNATTSTKARTLKNDRSMANLTNLDGRWPFLANDRSFYTILTFRGSIHGLDDLAPLRIQASSLIHWYNNY